VDNIAIANTFLFLTILSMAVSAQLGMPIAFVLSAIGTVLAGAMRHDELEKTRRIR